MQRPSPAALSALLLAVLLPLFYPALFLERRLAPEAALHSVAPWRSLLGPYPQSSPLIVEAASSLGPRLAAIAREPAASALWNPWIGGGRGGWLSSAREGGTPLTVAAACLARPGWRWTALLALTVGIALASAYWVVRLSGFPTAAAAVGAAAYALSGAASSAWLTADGAALALGPLLLVPLLHPTWSDTRRAGAGAAALVVALYSGAQAAQFVAIAAACLVAAVAPAPRPSRRWAWPVLATLLALAVLAPRLWLHATASEPGAPVAPATPVAAPGVLAAVVPFTHALPPATTLAPSSPRAETLRGTRAAFVGVVVLLLAAVGAARPFPAGGRAFWLGMTATAALLAHLPDGLGGGWGLLHRPLGAAALGFAVLAAAGSHLLMRRLASPPARAWLGAAILGAVLLRLLPVAAHGLPFVPATSTVLEHPVGPAKGEAPPARLVAFGATLPPDTAAAFSLPDLRAASLAAEPRFAAALRPRDDGTVTFDRVFDPALARLGARLLMEPAQLHVISAELFSRTVAAQGMRLAPAAPGETVISASLPEGAVRLALPVAGAPVEGVALVRGGAQHTLSPDPALALESDAWSWFGLPAGVSAGEVTLVVRPAAAVPDEPTLLWDTSGLLLVGERAGARTWLATQARPPAFVARALAGDGGPAPTDPLAVLLPGERLAALAATAASGAARVHVAHAAATRVAVQAHTDTPRLLVIMVKHRPALWRARINGVPAATEVVDGVWTGLVIPRGTCYVELEARLPWWVALAAGAGLAGSALLFLAGRRRLPHTAVQGVRS